MNEMIYWVHEENELPSLLARMEAWKAESVTLWTEERVQQLMKTALVIDSGRKVMLSPASPADATEAASRLGFPYFSHLKNDYPIYGTAGRY